MAVDDNALLWASLTLFVAGIFILGWVRFMAVRRSLPRNPLEMRDLHVSPVVTWSFRVFGVFALAVGGVGLCFILISALAHVTG